MVIAIIGILIALLLPAVQAARESARRTQCNNNLKNWALGCQNYHSAHKILPRSWGYLHNDGDRDGTEISTPPPRTCLGWMVSLLPYVEETPMFEQFKPFFSSTATPCNNLGGFLSTLPASNPANTLRVTAIPILHCPSDDSVRGDETVMKGNKPTELRFAQWQFDNLDTALSSYKGVIGDIRLGGSGSVHQGREPDSHPWTDNPGLFFRNSYKNPVSFKKITDGLSKTYMIGEDVPLYNWHSAAWYANGDWSSCHAPLNYIEERPDFGYDWWDAISFRSRHPGGAHFARADGSVEFVSETIDIGEYRSMCTRNGIEIGEWEE